MNFIHFCKVDFTILKKALMLTRFHYLTGERKREKEGPDGCSLVGKDAQRRSCGHGFNPYIPKWHLLK